MGRDKRGITSDRKAKTGLLGEGGHQKERAGDGRGSARKRV